MGFDVAFFSPKFLLKKKQNSILDSFKAVNKNNAAWESL